MDRERELKWLKVDSIVPNANNPREDKEFTEDALDRLRASMSVHGPLAPIIVSQIRAGQYKLIDGDRRLKTATILGIKELPAMIVHRMPERDEIVTAYNIHTLAKPWEVAEELRAIKDLMSRNGHRPHEEIAKELGMHLTTFRDRLRVLDMGDPIVSDISADKIQFSGALRSDQVAEMLAKKRPALVKKLGGQEAVRDKLIAKAKTRKRGISQELVQNRHDLADTGSLSDSAVEQYIKVPEARLHQPEHRQVRHHQPERHRSSPHASEDFAGRLLQVERDAKRFDLEGMTIAQLGKMRRTLAASIDALSTLEARVSDAIASDAG